MATNNALTCITGIAGSDLSAAQYRFVNNPGSLALATDGSSADAVLQDKPAAAGRAATIAIDGVSKVVAGAAIALHANVASDANGKAKVAVTGNRVLGKALEAATAADQVITVLLKLQGVPNV